MWVDVGVGYCSLPAPRRPYRKGVGMTSEREVFVTATGVELTLKRISPLLLGKITASVEMPSRPTYEAQTVAGEIETHEHNETTLETDEDRAAWQKYLIDSALAQQEVNTRVTLLLFRRGIDYEALELPEDEHWIEEQEALGVEVPTDPLERKIHYMETEAFTSRDEIKRLTVRLMAMTDVPEEVLAAAERSFRDPMEGEAAGESEDQGGGVELQQDLPEGEDSPGVGADN